MGKGLVKEMREVRMSVVALAVMVIVLGGAMVLRHWNGERKDVAVASLGSYASIEATRIAKMAELMLGMGGEYTAKCEAVYDSVTDKVETKYSITWYREPTAEELEAAKGAAIIGRLGITETWTGATWGECIGKMMAWRGGE